MCGNGSGLYVTSRATQEKIGIHLLYIADLLFFCCEFGMMWLLMPRNKQTAFI